MTILFVLWLVILQPNRFKIETKKNIAGSVVYAQISEKWNAENDGSVKFDLFIPGSNEEGEIVYEVKAWDTLSEIAKTFWTTTNQLIEVNGMNDANDLQPGQKLDISNAGDDIIYNVESEVVVADFAANYDLDLKEVIELNYFPGEDFILVEGQQLFLNLTREQAELKDLWQTPEYVRPAWLVEDLPEDFLVKDAEEGSWSLVDTLIGAITWWASGEWETQIDSDVEEELTDIEKLIDQGEPQQRVISAVDTTNQLEEQELALLEAITQAKNEEERKKLEAEKKILEEKLVKERAANKAREEAAEAEAIQAEVVQEVITAEQTTDQIDEANAPEPEPTPEPVQEVITAEETTQKIEQITSCGENKCLHKGKCRSIPSNAYCTPDDNQNAWKCEEGYVDTRRSCVEEKKYEEQTSNRWTQPKKSGTIAQRYFNPYNDGYGNGWGAGHCTHYSWWYRWKHYGIMTNWRWNGGQRYWNASAAWRQVGKNPEVWAIFVADSGSGRRSSYGHVWIVIKVDWASNSILVEDMNYAGRYIVTQRWMSMNEAGLIWYVYPRKK